ncbi:hypothetical protein QQX98_012655 [Neonectria punicea]|uniref:DNA-directed RNA polymerase I subunit RPA34.5 n=1 Tax=Neonectria punicea TaxID=979145 RepID=A0ABR1GI74_9HYPO
MAPKEQYKVHSLQKHIENTKKGLSADAQFNRRPGKRAPIVKQDPDSFDPNNLFKTRGDDDDDDEAEASGSGSSSDSEGEGGSEFLAKLAASVKAPVTPSRRGNKDVEIADSDVERNASSKHTNATKNAVKAKPEAESSDDTSSESKSESESEAKAKTNGVKVTKASASSSSTSSSSDSESDSDSDSDSEPTKPTAAEDSSAESSSDESSEDEPEAKAKPVVNGTTAAKSTSSETKTKTTTKTKPIKSTKLVEPESDSSSSGGEEDEDDEMADESMHIEHRRDNRQLAIPNFIAPDFVLRKSDDGANGKDVAEICNKANLEGKQVWYFTVPSNVPISVVQNLEIPMDNSQRGDPLFSHDGEDYGISFESITPKGNIQILIPSTDGSQYRSASRQVNQVMQIKKTTQLASLPSSAIGPAEKRTPRAQPKGLKSRYQPIGVNTSSDNIGAAETNVEADTEMTEAPALSSASKTSKKKSKEKDTPTTATPTVGKDKEQKKRRESVTEAPSSLALGVSTPDVSRKGKRKHTVSEEDAAAAAAQLMLENNSAVSNPKKQKTTRSGSPDLGSEPPSTATKKQTPVLPPSFPQIPAVSTPVPAPSTAKKSKKTKEPKEPKLELPVLPTSSKQTPIPLPAIPHSSQSVPVGSPSVAKSEKRTKKRKEKESAATPSRKVTPVPPPQVFSSS